MKRCSGTILVWMAFCVCLLSTACNPDQGGATEKGAGVENPNIVFILVDDMGWSDLPVYGNQFHETPNVDRLAREGMRFTDAYAAAPVCSPTRASLVSGQYPARVGITEFIPGHWRPYEKVIVPKNRTQFLPDQVVTFAELLRDKGYATGYFGKWHLGDDQGYTPDQQGFEESVVFRGWGHFQLQSKLFPPQDVTEEEYLTDFLAKKSVGFLEAHREGPFFLYMAHFAVHLPLEAKQKLVEKYQQKPKPQQGVNNPVYAAMVEHVDQSVGVVLNKLDELGLAENTVVVLFSDNGGLSQRFDKADGVVVTTNAPLRDEKGSLYEGGIREPLIVRWPGVTVPGSISNALATSVDLYPTFLELAGVDPDKEWVLDGQSLVPALKGEKPDPERAIFWHYPHYHHSTPAGAVRQGDYKLLEFYDEGRVELYHLTSDIQEEKNLAVSEPARAAELKALLENWRSSVGAEMPQVNPEFREDRRGEWGTHPDRIDPPEWTNTEEKKPSEGAR